MLAKAVILLATVSGIFAVHSYDGIHFGTQGEQTVRGFGGLSTVSKQAKSVVSPHSAVTKHDVRVTNDGLAYAHAPVHHAYDAGHYAHAAPLGYAHPAPHGVAYAPEAHYAHATPVHHAYAHPAPVAVAAPVHHAYAHHPAPVAVAAPVVKTALPVAPAPYAAHHVAAPVLKAAAPVYHQAPLHYAPAPVAYAHSPLVAKAVAPAVVKTHAALPLHHAAPVHAVHAGHAYAHAPAVAVKPHYSLISPNVFSLAFEGHGIKYHY